MLRGSGINATIAVYARPAVRGMSQIAMTQALGINI